MCIRDRLNADATQPVKLCRGDAIAQLVIQKVERVEFLEVDELSDSERGSGGYGSTGGVSQWRQRANVEPDVKEQQ